MLYAPTAGVTPEQITAARDSILAMDGSPAFMHAIMQEKFWRDFLQASHADRFAAIEADYQQGYTKLSEETGLSDEAELQKGSELTLARDQQINRLIEELTLQAYNAPN